MLSIELPKIEIIVELNCFMAYYINYYDCNTLQLVSNLHLRLVAIAIIQKCSCIDACNVYNMDSFSCKFGSLET